MLLPECVSRYKDTDVKLLPSSTTKHSIWELYLQAAAASSMHACMHASPARRSHNSSINSFPT